MESFEFCADQLKKKKEAEASSHRMWRRMKVSGREAQLGSVCHCPLLLATRQYIRQSGKGKRDDRTFRLCGLALLQFRVHQRSAERKTVTHISDNGSQPN